MNTHSETAADAAPSSVAHVPAVRVTLCGSRAQGRSFLIDAGIWERVAATYGDAWSVLEQNGKPYIYTSRMDAIRAAGALSTGTTVLLSRLVAALILGGRVPKHVFFRSGNSLDLRSRNLVFDRADVPGLRPHRPVIVTPYEDVTDDA